MSIYGKVFALKGFNEIIRESIRKVLLESEQDDLYLNAYRDNDTDTAMRMVLQAAKAAMPNTKVVDDNGNPMVIWRGGLSNLANKYEFGKTPLYRDESSIGIFFTIDRNVASAFARGRDVISVYCNVKKPFIVDAKGKGYLSIPVDENSPSWVKDEYFLGEIDIDSLPRLAIENGFDGIVVENVVEGIGGYASTDIVVFNPSQIKSAEPFVFDDSGNLIPLSQRFDFSKNDIRY